jgi:tRNA threonylcarbamoyladenosine biosynthesis protein TsaE
VRTETSSPEATEAVGFEVGAALSPGDVVLVAGELGTGKTTFVRGACRAIGVRGPAVTSPTFTIGQLYAGERDGRRLEVAHLDLYRLGTLEDEEPGLLEDYLTPERVGFVEWPEAAAGTLPDATVRVVLQHLGGDRRRVEVS